MRASHASPAAVPSENSLVRQEHSAGGVVVEERDGRWWTVAIRPRRQRPRAVWALPKGRVEPGEVPAQAAVRETSEETGLETEPIGPLGRSEYVYTWEGERIAKRVDFFLLRVTGGVLGQLPPGMELEVETVTWLPLDEAVTTLSYDGERVMARRALLELEQT